MVFPKKKKEKFLWVFVVFLSVTRKTLIKKEKRIQVRKRKKGTRGTRALFPHTLHYYKMNRPYQGKNLLTPYLVKASAMKLADLSL